MIATTYRAGANAAGIERTLNTIDTWAISPANLIESYNPAKAKKLHIVLVTETWVPDINGVSLSLKQLMTQLAAMGHTISLIKPEAKAYANPQDHETDLAVENSRPYPMGPANGNEADELMIANILSVKGMPIPRYPELQLGMPTYGRIKRYLQDIRPDIVHIATEGPLGLAALLAAKRLKLAVTTGYHTQFHDFSKHFGMGLLSRPLMAYFKYFHNGSDATCVPSPKTQNDLAELGFKRLVQVGRGVDIERFNPSKRSEALRKSWGAGQQHTVVIMVSRLSPEKGVDLVIKSYQALQMQQLHRAMKLIIVGDGPDRARLQALAMGGDDIIFAGAQLGEDLAEHYASGDAFVFASQVETFGNVVTEAMASGLPIYAFDDAAAGMLVDEQCGALSPLGDSLHFIEMVSDLPKMQQLKQLGQQSRDKVLQMSWGRPAQQMLTMFLKVIKSKSNRSGLSQPLEKGLENTLKTDLESNKPAVSIAPPKVSVCNHTELALSKDATINSAVKL